ncbi:DUF3231 family protein [Bacillus sp. T3]|uniref:DUF3231 family protein n=1 Tax=Bacillus sp. T3 TaxID=467262 RepID=UPI0029821B1E|nr:DUF3231 family protein [Bacillus sp. T3]
MDTIKPIKIHARDANLAVSKEPLSAAEVGKLWATYMGNTMAKQVLKFFLHHCEDSKIKKVVENALNLSEGIVSRIEELFRSEQFPTPVGFTEDDLNLDAPRLFVDDFYLHYLKYAGKAGLTLYGIAVPLMTRLDVREFYSNVIELTVKLINQVNDIFMDKGLMMKIPTIPIPEKVDFVKKQNYLNGFLGDIRPLHGLEVAHLFDNIENNATSKAVLTGFYQVAKNDDVRKYFHKGKDLTVSHIEHFEQILHKDDMPAPSFLDHLVTTSTIAPFSDKLMMFHKIDMFSMRIRAYGNSLSVNGRKDLGVDYSRFLAEVGLYVKEGAEIFIDHGWMEQPPEVADRDHLSSQEK